MAYYNGNRIVNVVTLAAGNQIQNPNLLINGDFRVNQRGQTTYTGTNSINYSVDRWAFLYSQGFSFDTTTNTLSVTENGAFAQFIEDTPILLGKTVTLSAKVDGVVYSGTATLNNSYSSDSYLITVTMLHGKLSLIYNTSRHLLRAGIIEDGGASYNIKIDYIKLEIGSIATQYSPRPFAEELQMCQRYFQTLRINGNMSIATSTTTIYTGLALPVTLRTAPTITNVNQTSMRQIGVGNKGNVDIAYSNLYNNIIQLQASVLSLGISSNAGVLWANGEITADAEIY